MSVLYDWMLRTFVNPPDTTFPLRKALEDWQGQTVKGITPLDVLGLIPVPGIDLAAEALKGNSKSAEEGAILGWRKKWIVSGRFLDLKSDTAEEMAASQKVLRDALAEARLISAKCPGIDTSMLSGY